MTHLGSSDELDAGHYTLSGASGHDTSMVLSLAGTFEVISHGARSASRAAQELSHGEPTHIPVARVHCSMCNAPPTDHRIQLMLCPRAALAEGNGYGLPQRLTG